MNAFYVYFCVGYVGGADTSSLRRDRTHHRVVLCLRDVIWHSDFNGYFWYNDFGYLMIFMEIPFKMKNFTMIFGTLHIIHNY